MNKEILCPRCNGKMSKFPALSRLDNKTHICSDCGNQEALFDFYISQLPTEKEKLIYRIQIGEWLPPNKYKKYLNTLPNLN